MTSLRGDEVRPFHLPGRRGALLGLYHTPSRRTHSFGDVLVAPSFGEEMNRCRAMVAMQARELARLGIGTLILDPYGTGDSAGEFSEGSWELWREDLQRGIDWLRRVGNGCSTLWGIRLGAIMATELAAADEDIRRLLLWQPVVEGKSFFTQFLRIRIAAELEQSGGIKSTEELRRLSGSGANIEVGGYSVGPELARELDRIALPPASRLPRVSVGWFEVLAAGDSNVARPNQKAADAWQAAGLPMSIERVCGPPFWQVHERAVAIELIGATSRLVSDRWLAAVDTSSAGSTRASQDNPAEPQTWLQLAERPVVFPCEGDSLVGVIHHGRPSTRRGVIIVVAGGPQYRAGAHRQFVSLARKLAANGNPVLRFDLRGMGDSSGEHRGFEHSEADIRAAIDALLAQEPEIEEVVLFGECESASGILFYAYRDSRVKGIALVNPWVRTEGGRAEVIIKHYYASRLLSPEFWRKLRSGDFNVAESLRGFISTFRDYLRGRKLRRQRGVGANQDLAGLPLPVKTAVGLQRFRGPVMILISGHDYIAREFDEVVKSSAAWHGLLEQPRVYRRDMPGADHTFSREVWKRQASDWVCEWLGTW